MATLVATLAVGGAVRAQQEPPPLAIDPALAHTEIVRALEEARSFLPVGFALEAMAGTVVAVHQDDDRHVAQAVEQDGVPVLLLAERSYFATGRMIDLADAAIDSVSLLFEALFELWAQRTWLADPERAAELEEIAAELYVDLPEELRREALIDAQGQYAGHLASIAAAVERSARRGVGLCRKLHDPRAGPLFRLWERTGDAIEYAGTVWIGDQWLTSEIDLPPEQRAAVRVGPLEGRWSGRVEEDFGRRYCR